MNAFQGFNEAVLTFKGTATPGCPVKVDSAETVAACADGQVFCGVCTGGSGGFVGVQLTGFVCLPYSGAAPAVGYGKLAADSAGGVKTLASGREYLILSVDTANRTVGFIL